MARGKRRAPMKPTVDKPSNFVNGNDEVDDFVAQRHKVMIEKTVPDESDSEDMGPEPEIHERDVLNIDMSDSSSLEDSDESDGGSDDLEERKGWGGKKRAWYGGDTHEYEIMEDEEREEAFKDEEEEALRLQKEALSGMCPEDFGDEEDTDADVNKEQEDADSAESQEISVKKPTGDVLKAVAPEVPVLLQEMLECRKQSMIWRNRVHWNQVARTTYHLHASLVNNVAFYLSLRTDPDSVGVDIRTHPVLIQIVRIRALLKEALALSCEEPSMKRSDSPANCNGSGDAVQLNDRSEPQNGYLEIAEEDGAGRKGTKRKHKKRKKRSTSEIAAYAFQKDEEMLRSLLPQKPEGNGDDSAVQESDRKRRRLNKLIGAMERDRKNSDGKRLASGDIDVTRTEPSLVKVPLNTPRDDRDLSMDLGDMQDDEAVMQRMVAKKAKKEARKVKKAAASEPHVYRFKDHVDPEERRRASAQVVKNRGLTRYRPRDKKTPRTKNRIAYGKAVVRRKGAVQEYVGKPGSNYAGEASGINMSARKGSRLSNV